MSSVHRPPPTWNSHGDVLGANARRFMCGCLGVPVDLHTPNGAASFSCRPFRMLTLTSPDVAPGESNLVGTCTVSALNPFGMKWEVALGGVAWPHVV